MNTPVRLLREGATDFERELLRSYEHEQPSARARRRALAIAGSSAAVVLTTSATAKAASAIGSHGGLAAMVAKWLAVGAVAGLATSTATLATVGSTRSPETKPHAPIAATPVATGAAPTQETETPIAPPVAEPAADVKPRAEATPRATPAATALSAAKPPRGALGPETALLDRAREALRSGSTARALELTSEYQREFPSGVLAQEAEVLRIDALERQGNRAEAARSAERFLTTNPTSAHAERLRRLSTNP